MAPVLQTARERSYTPVNLSQWEKAFRSAIGELAIANNKRAAVLLPAVPDRSQWDHYLSSVRTEWQRWKSNFWQHSSCLVILYAGLAFYEYDENRFWPQFSRAVGESLSPKDQHDINTAFAKAAKYLGLTVTVRDKGSDFVGSAIGYIGIPLSLWDGFLDICDWALWRKDWKTLSAEGWTEAVDKITGGRRRLKKFLTDNRETTSSLIQDMLDAREILIKDTSLAIRDIAQASVLRIEYFEELPDTASFLRPQNPDSLFRDHARVIWNENRKQISLQLPGVDQQKLPALWRIGARTQAAAHGPDELVLNASAFVDPLLLSLESGGNNEVKRLRGLTSWGLFDLESGGRLVNSARDELPLKSYALVSDRPLVIEREGFDGNENPANEPFELNDGSTCFVTDLWPTGKVAQLRVDEHRGCVRTIRFRTKAKIEARFFAGIGECAANFSRIEDFVKIEQWPVLYVSIPQGYFRDTQAELAKTFQVLIDDKPAGGRWSTPIEHDDRQYYVWNWSSSRPVIEQVRTGTAKAFSELHAFFHAPSLKGKRILSIKSPEFTVQYKVYKEEPKPGMEKCWKALPGAFLPLFLVCQSTEGMKWEDLVLAKDVIAPKLRLSPYLLRKYAHHGFLVQRGQRWFISESRAELKPNYNNCHIKYCGDPSIWWGLYRRMYHEMRGVALPTIEVVNNRGEIPYLQTTWPLRLRNNIEQYFRNRQVILGPILWTH